MFFNPGKALDKNWVTPGGGLVWQFLLLKGIWVPDIDLAFVADLVPGTNELTGGGYARQAIANPSIVIDNAANVAKHLCDNPSWAALTAGDLRYLVAFLSTGVDATSPLHSYYDLGQQAISGATLNPQIQNGVLFEGT